MRELDFARRIAVRAGLMLKKNRLGRRSIRFKAGAGNLVTDMDHASESDRQGPPAGFPTTRSWPRRRSGGRPPHRWYIDPIDGTTNYAHGFPAWAVAAYERHGRIEAGVTCPLLDEIYWARRGACPGTRRIHVAACRRLEAALLGTGFSYNLEWRRVNLGYFAEFLMKAQAIRRVGVASLDLCWTAAGAFDGFWEMRLGPWDMAAGIVILEEAGARVSDFEGRPVDIHQGDLVGANPRLHRQMLAVLEGVRRAGAVGEGPRDP
jgi:myo-inositol-1(or 4)-monophosphatase